MLLRTLPILLILLFAVPSASAVGLRCSGGLVSRGDHMVEVLAACGEPLFRDKAVAYPSRMREYDGRPFVEYLPLAVVTEEWVYEFGPHRFRQLLRFRNNRLASIETLRKPR